MVSRAGAAIRVFTKHRAFAIIAKGFRRIVSRMLNLGQVILSRVSVKSALNPSLYLVGMCLLVCGTLAMVGRYHVLCSWVVGVSIVHFLISHWFLILFDRDRLQSEHYLLKRQEMILLHDGEKTVRPSDRDKIEDVTSTCYRLFLASSLGTLR